MYNNDIPQILAHRPQTLVHLPRRTLSAHPPESSLPRGQCRFLITGATASSGGDCTPRRCDCVSFFPDKNTHGTLCGCGHQPWHHLSEPHSGDCVGVAEFSGVLDRIKRLEDEHAQNRAVITRLEQELKQEKVDRQVDVRAFKNAILGVYQNMKLMRVMQDEKIDTVLNDTQKHELDLHRIWEKLDLVDEATMQLENRANETEGTPAWKSGSSTPIPEPNGDGGDMVPESCSTDVAASERTLVVNDESWSAKIIVLPSKSQPFAFAHGQPAYMRCASRRLHQNFSFTSHSADEFVNHVSGAFAFALHHKHWMPLVCVNSSTKRLAQLAPNQRDPNLWDYHFLERNAFTHDKAEGDLEVIYIVLQHEDLSWDFIRSLPADPTVPETCWTHDNELDGVIMDPIDMMETDSKWPLKGSRPATAYSTPEARKHGLKWDFQRLRRPNGYDPSPPPYSQSQHSARPITSVPLPQQPSTFLQMAHNNGRQSGGLDIPLIPNTYAYSTHSTDSGLSSPLPTPLPKDSMDIRSIHSAPDQHRHKRPRSKRSVDNLSQHNSNQSSPRPSVSSDTAMSRPAIAPPVPSRPTKIQVSGRTKRTVKVNPTSGKAEPPFHDWGFKKAGLGLLHHGKGKEKEKDSAS